MLPSPSPNKVSTLKCGFRSSILGLWFPLSTLKSTPYDAKPITRGLDGVLTLPSRGLASEAASAGIFYRFISAHWVSSLAFFFFIFFFIFFFSFASLWQGVKTCCLPYLPNSIRFRLPCRKYWIWNFFIPDGYTLTCRRPSPRSPVESVTAYFVVFTCKDWIFYLKRRSYYWHY